MSESLLGKLSPAEGAGGHFACLSQGSLVQQSLLCSRVPRSREVGLEIQGDLWRAGREQQSEKMCLHLE